MDKKEDWANNPSHPIHKTMIAAYIVVVLVVGIGMLLTGTLVRGEAGYDAMTPFIFVAILSCAVFGTYLVAMVVRSK